MQIIEPEGELAALLGEYEAAGGEIAYLITDLAPPETLDVVAHREVALQTVRQAMSRTAPFPLEAAACIDRGLPNRFATMSPVQIDGQRFMGPVWAPTRKVLVVRGQSGRGLNRWFYANDEERSENALDHMSWIPRLESGYAYAFSAPPHGMSGSARRLSELFVAINRHLFPYDVYDKPVTIYEWPTDWSSYFDAGHEGWGSFLWTVSWPGWRIVGVTASATD